MGFEDPKVERAWDILETECRGFRGNFTNCDKY